MFNFKSESTEQMKTRIRLQINTDTILALTQHSFKEENANKDSNTINATFTRRYSAFNYQG